MAYHPKELTHPFMWGVLIIAVGCVFSAQLAHACDTPVYRYAMYNWGTSPQMVFCFHSGALQGKNAQIAKKLESVAKKSPAPNIFYRPIDVDNKEILERLDPDVRQFWETQGKKKTPWWLVVSAWGAVLHCGEWNVEAVDALVDSPLRRRVGELLHDGDAAVFLLLEGTDKEENAEAVSAAEKVVANVAANNIRLPEDTLVVELGGSEGASPEDSQINVDLVRLSLEDAKEKGLIEQLLMVEPGLKEDEGTPMLFPIYGRGRAMRPFIGKGINERNLSDAVLFLIGDCSCMAKEQNPGVDLCFAWDWESTADHWAMQEEAGSDAQSAGSNSLVYQEFSLDEFSSEEKESGEAAEDNIAPVTEPLPTQEATAPAVGQQEKETPAAKESAADKPTSGEVMGKRQIWIISVILGVLALGVFATGTVLLKR